MKIYKFCVAGSFYHRIIINSIIIFRRFSTYIYLKTVLTSEQMFSKIIYGMLNKQRKERII